MKRVKNKLFWLYTRQITELLLKIKTIEKNQGGSLKRASPKTHDYYSARLEAAA